MTAYTTYVSHGVDYWLFLTERYGVPGELAKTLLDAAAQKLVRRGQYTGYEERRERLYKTMRLACEAARDLGYTKKP